MALSTRGSADSDCKPKFSHGFTAFRMKVPGRRAKVITAVQYAKSQCRL